MGNNISKLSASESVPQLLTVTCLLSTGSSFVWISYATFPLGGVLKVGVVQCGLLAVSILKPNHGAPLLILLQLKVNRTMVQYSWTIQSDDWGAQKPQLLQQSRDILTCRICCQTSKRKFNILVHPACPVSIQLKVGTISWIGRAIK